MDIIVTYDGKYPNACTGTLTISVNNNIVYSKQDAVYSTGSCGYDKSLNDYTAKGGSLLWNVGDAEKFNPNIRAAVQHKLNQIKACCGGCT